MTPRTQTILTLITLPSLINLLIIAFIYLFLMGCAAGAPSAHIAAQTTAPSTPPTTPTPPTQPPPTTPPTPTQPPAPATPSFTLTITNVPCSAEFDGVCRPGEVDVLAQLASVNGFVGNVFLTAVFPPGVSGGTLQCVPPAAVCTPLPPYAGQYLLTTAIMVGPATLNYPAAPMDPQLTWTVAPSVAPGSYPMSISAWSVSDPGGIIGAPVTVNATLVVQSPSSAIWTQ